MFLAEAHHCRVRFKDTAALLARRQSRHDLLPRPHRRIRRVVASARTWRRYRRTHDHVGPRIRSTSTPSRHNSRVSYCAGVAGIAAIVAASPNRIPSNGPSRKACTRGNAKGEIALISASLSTTRRLGRLLRRFRRPTANAGLPDLRSSCTGDRRSATSHFKGRISSYNSPTTGGKPVSSCVHGCDRSPTITVMAWDVVSALPDRRPGGGR